MTTFCSQCGKPVREGGKFCQSCGAPSVQSSPAASAPAGYPSGGYGGASAGYQGSMPAQSSAPVMGQYETPAPRSSNALKIILITLAVLLVLIGGTVVAVTYVFRRAVTNMVQVNEGKDGQPNVVLDIPGVPKISAGGTITEEQLGVPIYPGAEPEKDGTTSISMSGSSQGWMGVATYRTSDAMDDVVAFYSEKLGGAVKAVDESHSGKRSAVFQLESPKGWRMVTIAEEEQEKVTKIMIASVTGGSKSQ
jgi:hypothetical protein